MRCVLFVAFAAVSLPIVAAWDPKECHQYLAEEAKHEVVHAGWGGMSFNTTRYTTVAGDIQPDQCSVNNKVRNGAKFAKVIRDNDIVYVNGTVTADGGVLTGQNGNGTWARDIITTAQRTIINLLSRRH